MSINSIQSSNTLNVEVVEQAIQSIVGEQKATFVIRDRQTGDVLFNHRGQHLMRPASNMKILSGAAALKILGEDFTFQTKLYVDGTQQGGTLNGNVYVRGAGDPTLNGDVFRQFAQQLKEKGITHITGHVIGDDTYFTGDTLPPGVDAEGETHYYGARVTALTMSPNNDYDAGTLYVEVTPTEEGAQPTFTVVPNLCGHTITNEAQTIAADAEETLEVRRTNGTKHITITGGIPAGEAKKVWVSLQNPTMDTLHYIRTVFTAEGITFGAQTELIQQAVPANAQLLYTHQSPTLAELFNPFMKLSNNTIADILVKTIGYERYGIGDYESGLKEVRAYLRQKNIDITTWKFVDGSGLSHQIKVNSEGISKLLFVLQNEPYFETFYASLPVAGQVDRQIGGTLNDRYIEKEFEQKIVAKTGYIDEVNCLSGYVTGASGTEYIVSLLVEGYEEYEDGIEALDDTLKAIVNAL